MRPARLRPIMSGIDTYAFHATMKHIALSRHESQPIRSHRPARSAFLCSRGRAAGKTLRRACRDPGTHSRNQSAGGKGTEQRCRRAAERKNHLSRHQPRRCEERPRQPRRHFGNDRRDPIDRFRRNAGRHRAGASCQFRSRSAGEPALRALARRKRHGRQSLRQSRDRRRQDHRSRHQLRHGHGHA